MLCSRLVVLSCVVGPLAWIFWPALAGGQSFVFRDAAHFYHPLYQWVAARWATGHVPLWNPADDLGQPLLADATAAVLYPGKLLFALPIDYGDAYNLYIVAQPSSEKLVEKLVLDINFHGSVAEAMAFGINEEFTGFNFRMQ